jgi:hypothetical protein
MIIAAAVVVVVVVAVWEVVVGRSISSTTSSSSRAIIATLQLSESRIISEMKRGEELLLLHARELQRLPRGGGTMSEFGVIMRCSAQAAR